MRKPVFTVLVFAAAIIVASLGGIPSAIPQGAKADGSNERLAILDRKSLEEIGHIGRPGRKAGEFFHIHSLDVDPQGYRVQKFIYKGLSTTAR
jgi:hypothetical protein